jgi:hypothetical protein
MTDLVTTIEYIQLRTFTTPWQPVSGILFGLDATLTALEDLETAVEAATSGDRVCCLDVGTLTCTTLAVPAGVVVYAPWIDIAGSVTLLDGSSIECRSIAVAAGTAISKATGTGIAYAVVETISDTGAGTGVSVGAGTVMLRMVNLDCTTAYTVATGCVLYLHTAYLSGTETLVGTGKCYKLIQTDGTGGLTLTGNLVVQGDVDLGNAITDSITCTGRFDAHLIPLTDDTYDLGDASVQWRNLYIDGTANIDSLVADTADIDAGTIDGTTIGGTAKAAGSFTTLVATGDVDLGDAITDSITCLARFDSHLIPLTDDTYDLGDATVQWRNLYIDGTANIDSLVADTADIDAGTIDGVTIGGTTKGAGGFTTLVATGNVDLGDAITDSITCLARFDAHLIPLTDDTYDLGDATVQWRNLYIDGTANIDSLVADTADIDAGTIDGTTIGGTTKAAGGFTTLVAAGDVDLGDAITDSITCTGRFDAHLIPIANNTYNLGDAAVQWGTIYARNAVIASGTLTSSLSSLVVSATHTETYFPTMMSVTLTQAAPIGSYTSRVFDFITGDGNFYMDCLRGPTGHTTTLTIANVPLTSNTSITAGALFSTKTLTGASYPGLTITQTWDNVATTFNAMLVNITNTNSAAASTLFDFQVGGTSKIKGSKAGLLTIASGGGIDCDDTTDATDVTGTVGSIVSLGGGNFAKQLLAPNLINCKKGEIIELIYALIPAANIMGFWIFDQTGAVTTIVDRGTKGHNITLGGNASTLAPTVVGLCPSLLFADAAATEWSIASHADFSFGAGGTDAAWSTVTACTMTTITSTTLMAKQLVTGNKREWMLGFTVDHILALQVMSPDGTNGLARFYNYDLSGDAGSPHVYISTASGGSPQAIGGLKFYRDGSRVDDSTFTFGTYAGMTADAAPLSNSLGGVSEGMKGRGMVQLLVNIELSAGTALRLSNLLRAYMGVAI